MAHQNDEIELAEAETEAIKTPDQPFDWYESNGRKSRLGHYDLLRKLGSGEMGNVYLARQLGIERDVVIKVLPRRLQENPDYLDRFTKEAQVAAKLQHVNIVKAIDIGQSDSGRYYFVMEYAEGKNLNEILDQEKCFNEKKAIDITLQIARALSHGHARDLYHGEVRPENVRVTSGGIVKLTGLGLAKEVVDQSLSRTRMLLNAAHYASPEEVQGNSKDIRSDLYSLGATLYHMVTGKAPFDGSQAVEILADRLVGQLENPKKFNPEISDSCCQILERLLARDAEDRYQTPQDLLSDLELLAEGSRLESDRIAVEKSGLKRFPGRPMTRSKATPIFSSSHRTIGGAVERRRSTQKTMVRRRRTQSRPIRSSGRRMALKRHAKAGHSFFLGMVAGLTLILAVLGSYFFYSLAGV